MPPRKLTSLGQKYDNIAKKKQIKQIIKKYDSRDHIY